MFFISTENLYLRRHGITGSGYNEETSKIKGIKGGASKINTSNINEQSYYTEYTVQWDDSKSITSSENDTRVAIYAYFEDTKNHEILEGVIEINKVQVKLKDIKETLKNSGYTVLGNNSNESNDFNTRANNLWTKYCEESGLSVGETTIEYRERGEWEDGEYYIGNRKLDKRESVITLKTDYGFVTYTFTDYRNADGEVFRVL